jgi:SET domain-containing protein
MQDFRITDMPNGKFQVEVKESIGKGLGVFATKKIKKGEIICWYDGIFMKVQNENLQNTIPTLVVGKNGYNQHLDANGSIIAGFTKEFRKGGVAQLVNDYSTTTDIHEEFKNISSGKYNCDKDYIYDSNGNFKYLYFIATKTIKEGEEILHHYGTHYWDWTGDDSIFTETKKITSDYNTNNNTMRDFVKRAIIVNMFSIVCN